MVSGVIPPRKLHSSGNLAMGSVSFISLAIYLLFLVFPSCTFLFRFVLRAAGAGAGREAGPRDLGGDAWVQPFPPARTAAGAPSGANPNLSAGLWWGEAFGTPRSWQGLSPLGHMVPLAVPTNHHFPIRRQHQPRHLACLLLSNTEKKRGP